MRIAGHSRTAVLAAALVALACQKDKSEPDNFPPVSDAQFSPVPELVVADGAPLGPASDGPYAAENASRPEVNATRADARSSGDAKVADAAATADTAGGACSLLKQDCPGVLAGCYRTGSARTSCQTSDGLPLGSKCVEDSQCARGLICLDVCRQLCSTEVPMPCDSKLPCRVLPGYTPIGSCDL